MGRLINLILAIFILLRGHKSYLWDEGEEMRDFENERAQRNEQTKTLARDDIFGKKRLGSSYKKVILNGMFQ
ncbi:hypothetical protein B9Z55_011915 [Caenorhabditis nigoni]|uniref:Uncharacterized protein n=1 Tax=Caenorhabditis nigoni TaxID=1611254 RepID=A0A2G5UN08_9PELO|nr:hypothetical protein B9Z55_011915 [Caenorhabditis nigoni]